MGRIRLLIISIILLGAAFCSWKFVFPFFNGADALLKVTTQGVKSKIFLDDRLLGETSLLEDKLSAGEYSLRLEASLEGLFEKTVTFSTPVVLTSQTLTAVNYDFGPNELFSSGDIRTFRTGEGLSVITSPGQADVWLDGEIVGKSPASLTPNQGVHRLKITLDKHISREMEINIEPNLRLVVEVFLAADPFERVSKLEEGKLQIYDLTASNEKLQKEPKLWSEGVFFFEQKRGLNFDALVNTSGSTYFKNKTSWDRKIEEGKQIVIGYLGNKSAKGLTTQVQKTIDEIKSQLTPTKSKPAKKQVQILPTPTGTLNVRDGPGTSYTILTKVKPGQKYNLIEEKSDWYKINVSGTKGWVSSQYVKKI